MKNFCLFLSLIFFTSASWSQTNKAHVYKEWAMLGESSTHIDVSYRVVKCLSANQVHLFVFNESPNDQTANFDIEIVNSGEQKFIKSIIFATTKANMFKPDCNSDASLSALKIDLPSEYDPNKITLKITFK